VSSSRERWYTAVPVGAGRGCRGSSVTCVRVVQATRSTAAQDTFVDRAAVSRWVSRWIWWSPGNALPGRVAERVTALLSRLEIAGVVPAFLLMPNGVRAREQPDASPKLVEQVSQDPVNGSQAWRQRRPTRAAQSYSGDRRSRTGWRRHPARGSAVPESCNWYGHGERLGIARTSRAQGRCRLR